MIANDHGSCFACVLERNIRIAASIADGIRYWCTPEETTICGESQFHAELYYCRMYY
jgi:hypothetical protein